MTRLTHRLRPALAAIFAASLITMPGAKPACADSAGYKITVLPGGTEMEYSGEIGFNASGKLRSALNDNPAVKVLHLTSNGGNVYFARQMQYLVRDRGLITVVDAHCYSACAFVFLGGVERYLVPGAKLGFHRESAPGQSPAEINAIEESDAQAMHAMGISSTFVDKVFSTPSSDIWVPSADELKQAHVITDVSTKYATPDDAKVPANLAVQVLDANPFKILATSDPARFKAIGDQVRMTIGKLPAKADLQALPSREVAPLATDYWGLASDALAIEFGRAFESYLVKLSSKNPEECYLVFYAAHPPADYAESEILTGGEFADFADIQARLISDGAVRKAAIPAENDIKPARDAMWNVFKQRYPHFVATLENIDSPDNDHGDLCGAVTGMLDAILSLPESQSGPLLRYIFRPS
jgi:hypothetical protein